MKYSDVVAQCLYYFVHFLYHTYYVLILALQKFQVHEDTAIAYKMQSEECKF